MVAQGTCPLHAVCFNQAGPWSTRSTWVPSCEVWQRLVKLSEVWRACIAIFTGNLPFISRIPAKVPCIHQSSGESAFGNGWPLEFAQFNTVLSWKAIFSNSSVSMDSHSLQGRFCAPRFSSTSLGRTLLFWNFSGFLLRHTFGRCFATCPNHELSSSKTLRCVQR